MKTNKETKEIYDKIINALYTEENIEFSFDPEDYEEIFFYIKDAGNSHITFDNLFTALKWMVKNNLRNSKHRELYNEYMFIMTYAGDQ